jgi:quercetin dioxygenase-like cupin family protein
MKAGLRIIALAMALGWLFQAQAQSSDSIFPKGELSTTKNHTGNIWLNELVSGDGTFDPGIAVATYDAGARLDWHIHPADRFCSSPKALAIKPARVVRKGEVIKCPPGVAHWHAAAPNSTFAYIAVTPTSKGKAIWRGPVSDHDYKSVKQ